MLGKEQLIVSFLVGLFALGRVLFGLIAGWLPVRGWLGLPKRHYRGEQPFSYWFDIVLCTIIGVFLLGASACTVYPPWAPACMDIGRMLHLTGK
jgi:hypothetical protein